MAPTPRRLRRGRSGVILVAILVSVFVATSASGQDTHGARVVSFAIESRFVHQTMAVSAVIPPHSSGKGRALLVFLHGKGENQDSQLVTAMFAALAGLGSRAPDVVFPYGGADSYWHDRSSGAWSAYVLDEVIPEAVHRLGADPSRVAIGGLSMGGFGALDIARLHPGRFCAVGADSAALWAQGGETAAGAFDNAEDFARHDVLAAARSHDPYHGLAVWIDVGTLDPFRAADTQLDSELTADGQQVQFHIWPGGHDQGYWQAHWPNYLGFYAAALASCRRG
ncbi:MAG TPA: alpha/beta hydrolase-fold protein [Solirubrobacteraceae bacterium]|nr:alpha/beta hydrolase-fold protein [Solirubrobacteraceae bacterium]